MSEREAAIKRPKCPKCGEPDAARLHDGPQQQNWQCRNLKCLEQFQTPREVSVRELVEEERRRRAMSAEEVAKMANGNDLDCPKCGKSYKRGGMRRDKHVSTCKGAVDAAPAPRRQARKASPPPSSPEASPAKPMEMILVVTAVPEHLKDTALAPAVEHLLDRRKALEAELAETNVAISTISKLQPKKED